MRESGEDVGKITQGVDFFFPLHKKGLLWGVVGKKREEEQKKIGRMAKVGKGQNRPGETYYPIDPFYA